MIFVDTSAWLAVSDRRDGNHASAIEYYEELVRGKAGRLITSDYILDETLTILQKRVGMDGVRQFLDALSSSKSVHQAWVTPERFRFSLEIFSKSSDQAWSFTDCTSFAIMRELGIREAFTFDADFRQAGFAAKPG